MKNTIDLLNGLQVSKSVNFEKNVIKNLPADVKKIYLSSCGMSWEGRGSYNYFLDVEINDIRVTLKERTTDAQSYDNYKDLESGTRKFENWIKATALMLLDENRDFIIELTQEEEDNE
ncbi:MAG: hypothetical protein K2Y30_01965 [Flavobacteriaceae bacterium]|nr:hypothetical protein [Flavobacteriaceae bacterium]